MRSAGLDVEEFSKKVGWDLTEVDPRALWTFTVDGLRDVCAAAGVDWLAILPGRAGSAAQ
jgi:hypothetical protein